MTYSISLHLCVGIPPRTTHKNASRLPLSLSLTLASHAGLEAAEHLAPLLDSRNEASSPLDPSTPPLKPPLENDMSHGPKDTHYAHLNRQERSVARGCILTAGKRIVVGGEHGVAPTALRERPPCVRWMLEVTPSSSLVPSLRRF